MAMSWIDDPLALASTLPAFALPLAVFLAVLGKYLLPPVPGDTVVLLAFFLAGHGTGNPLVLFGAATFGGLAGAALAFQIGRRYGRGAMSRMADWRGPLGGERSKSQPARLFALFQRHGEPLLLVNRFLIGLRSFMLYGAGALRLRFVPSMIYALLSHMAFTALLATLGMWSGKSWQQLVERAQHFNQQIGLVITAIVAVWLLVSLRRSQLGERGGI